MERKRTRYSPLAIRCAALFLFILGVAQHEGWATPPAGLPPDVAFMIEAAQGEITIENFVAAPRSQGSVDLRGYFPLEVGSWWNHTMYVLGPIGWHRAPAQSSIIATQDMGGGTIASAMQYPGGEIEWLGWSSLGLLVFAEEETDVWSAIYRRPLYIVYNSMAVGSTCSGDTIIDLFMEPQHMFYGKGKAALSHTLLGIANVNLRIGQFLDSAIFSFESTWQEPGYSEYEKGIIVMAPGVGPIFTAGFSAWSIGWDFYFSTLSDCHIEPPGN